MRAHVVADRLQQVRLAQPCPAVDQQRVVRLARRLGDGQRRGVREAVRRSDDEGVERVLGQEGAAAAAVVARGGILAPRLAGDADHGRGYEMSWIPRSSRIPRAPGRVSTRNSISRDARKRVFAFCKSASL